MSLTYQDKIQLTKWDKLHPSHVDKKINNYLKQLKEGKVKYSDIDKDIFEYNANHIASKCASQEKMSLFKDLKKYHNNFCNCKQIKGTDNIIDELNNNTCLYVSIFYRFYYLKFYSLIDTYLEWHDSIQRKYFYLI